VLDRNGSFFHEGHLVEHPKLQAAMHTWVRRHPDDGRFILSNGYDWSYFTVEDAPYFIRAVAVGTDGSPELVLSDGSREALDPATLRWDPDDSLYGRVKAGHEEAKFTRSARLDLAPWLVEESDGVHVVASGKKVLLTKIANLG
jgi:hypothetical protein